MQWRWETLQIQIQEKDVRKKAPAQKCFVPKELIVFIALMSIFLRCFSVSVVLRNNCSAKINISWASSTTFVKPPLV